MEINVRVRSFALFGILLAGTACADNTATAPTGKTPLLRRTISTAGARRPTLFANTIKYRDKGKKNARGRAAIAAALTLEARALLGKDLRTTLDVSTGEIDGAPGTGVLNKIQLKLYAPDGALQTTTNYNNLNTPTYQTTLAGRVRGSKLQVQGKISAGNQTDVVTVTESVKLRPDLSIDRITAPAQARQQSSVNISALISELNGDVGARSDCVLFVDGVEADRAHGIWVDAGRSVSCLFSHTFPTTGTKQLTVSAVSVIPGDWDNANNTATSTINIVPPNDFYWQGSYQALTNWHGWSFSEGYWTRPDVGDRADWRIFQDMHHSDSWVAHVIGNVPAMGWPLAFSVQDEMDGTQLEFLAGDAATPSWTEEGFEEDPVLGQVHVQRTCATAFNLKPITFEGQDVMTSSAFMTVCTSLRDASSVPLPDRSFTDFNYGTSAGDVSYYGEHFETYDPGPNQDPSYGYYFSFNGDTDYSYGTLVFGKNYKFTVIISGAEVTRTASGTIQLGDPFVNNVARSYSCDDAGDETFFYHSCFSGNYTQTTLSAVAEGVPN